MAAKVVLGSPCIWSHRQTQWYTHISNVDHEFVTDKPSDSTIGWKPGKLPWAWEYTVNHLFSQETFNGLLSGKLSAGCFRALCSECLQFRISARSTKEFTNTETGVLRSPWKWVGKWLGRDVGISSDFWRQLFLRLKVEKARCSYLCFCCFWHFVQFLWLIHEPSIRADPISWKLHQMAVRIQVNKKLGANSGWFFQGSLPRRALTQQSSCAY